MAKFETDLTTLEELVDRYGMAGVIDMLGQVCDSKADHIRSSYGDTSLAHDWALSAGKLYRLTEKAWA